MKRLAILVLLGLASAQSYAQQAPAQQLNAARAADKAGHWQDAEPLYAAYLKAVPTDTTAAKDYAYVVLQCLERHPQPTPVDYYLPALSTCDKLIAAGDSRYLYYRARATLLRARVTHDEPHFAPLLSASGRDLMEYEKAHGPDAESQQLRNMLGNMGWKAGK